MNTLSLLFVILIFSMGHSYAQDLSELKKGEEVERAPHEAVVITEYEKLMNGEAPIDVIHPTDEYGLLTNNARILDQERVSGKVIGRSPAVVGEALSEKEFLDIIKANQE